jgi:hypothetical protein
MMMISPASWRIYKSSEYSRESLQEIRSFLLESKELSSITIIDSGFAKKILEKRVLEILLTYILLAAAEELMLLSRVEMEI